MDMLIQHFPEKDTCTSHLRQACYDKIFIIGTTHNTHQSMIVWDDVAARRESIHARVWEYMMHLQFPCKKPAKDLFFRWIAASGCPSSGTIWAGFCLYNKGFFPIFFLPAGETGSFCWRKQRTTLNFHTLDAGGRTLLLLSAEQQGDRMFIPFHMVSRTAENVVRNGHKSDRNISAWPYPQLWAYFL